MVTAKQKREIKQLMIRIKTAKESGADRRVIEDRTADLYNYLEREGIVMPGE